MISMNIKYLRTKHGMSQETLAEKLSVTRQTIAKWESGESVPDVKKCSDMAFLFNVSLDAMVTCQLDESTPTNETSMEDKFVFGVVKVGERGQVVIPKHARQVYDINSGDRLLVVGDHRGMALAKMKGLSEFFFEE